TSSTTITPIFFSKNVSQQASVSIIDNLSTLKFDGKGEMTLFEHISHFLKLCTKHNIHCEDVCCRFFILTFEGRVRQWCHTLTDAFIHSFKHLVRELFFTFYMYDRKKLCKKILEL